VSQWIVVPTLGRVLIHAAFSFVNALEVSAPANALVSGNTKPAEAGKPNKRIDAEQG